MEKKVALVTGAASGIGKAIASALLAQGHRVLLLDRSEAVQAVRDELGQDCLAYCVDLENAQEILAFTRRIETELGRCDVLVNNAGVHPKDEGGKVTLQKMALDSWNAVLAINLTAPMLLSQQLMPMMRPHGWGRIINIASRAGRTLIPACGAHYAATKAGLIGLTRVLAEEGAPDGITVNTVAPGRISTPLSNNTTSVIMGNALRNIPLGRVGQPEELAAAVTFLASDASSYMTGAVLDVNGGSFMP